jgi:hypothetical protein
MGAALTGRIGRFVHPTANSTRITCDSKETHAASDDALALCSHTLSHRSPTLCQSNHTLSHCNRTRWERNRTTCDCSRSAATWKQREIPRCSRAAPKETRRFAQTTADFRLSVATGTPSTARQRNHRAAHMSRACPRRTRSFGPRACTRPRRGAWVGPSGDDTPQRGRQ